MNRASPGSGGNTAPTAQVIAVDVTIGTLTARALDQPLEDGNLPRGAHFRLSDCAGLEFSQYSVRNPADLPIQVPMTVRSKGRPLHRLPWRHRFGAVAAALIVGTATLPTTASSQDGSGTPSTVEVAQLDGISSVPQNPRQPIGDELSNALAAPVPARVLRLADGRTAIPFPLTAVGNSISVQGEDGEGSVTIPVPAGNFRFSARRGL